MSALYAVLAFVIVERAAELALAAVNTRRLVARGGVEIDASGYKLFILLHGAWLLCLALPGPAAAPPSFGLLGVFALLQLGRLWVIASLGRRWTTRLIVLPGAALLRTGPYRLVRHPNYLIVAAEIAVLPLAFGRPVAAAAFSAVNIALLARRIQLEDGALANAAGRSPGA